MKRYVPFVITLLIAATSLSGCFSTGSSWERETEAGQVFTLPAKARLSLLIPDPLMQRSTSIPDGDTSKPVHEGQIIEKVAPKALHRYFQKIEVNDVISRPHVVVILEQGGSQIIWRWGRINVEVTAGVYTGNGSFVRRLKGAATEESFFNLDVDTLRGAWEKAFDNLAQQLSEIPSIEQQFVNGFDEDIASSALDLKKILGEKPRDLPRLDESIRQARNERFSNKPVDLTFPQAPENPNAVAVIIGNADYKQLGKEIPDVPPAYADAEGMRRYFSRALGVMPGNIIFLKDATRSQMTQVFGSNSDFRGKLYNWISKGNAEVYIYYAGHGALDSDQTTYLVPSDADASLMNLSGYPLALLYKNLGKLPSDKITLILEACFSGVSQAGPVVPKASPVYVEPRTPDIPSNVTVIAAGAANQIASWENDSRHSLFTKYFLKGMAGEADQEPYGDGDKTISLDELQAYLDNTMTYAARRNYGRDQRAQIIRQANPAHK